MNVTPDKKTVMLEKERHLLAVLRASMMRTYLGIVGSHSTVKSSVEDRRKLSIQLSQFSQSFTPSNESSPNASFDDSAVENPLDSSTGTQDDSLMNVADLLKQGKTRSPPPKRPCLTFQRPRESTSSRKTLDQFSFTMEPKPISSKAREVQKEKHQESEVLGGREEYKENVDSQSSQEKDDADAEDIEVLDEFPKDDTLPDSQDSGLFRPQQSVSPIMNHVCKRLSRFTSP